MPASCGKSSRDQRAGDQLGDAAARRRRVVLGPVVEALHERDRRVDEQRARAARPRSGCRSRGCRRRTTRRGRRSTAHSRLPERLALARAGASSPEQVRRRRPRARRPRRPRPRCRPSSGRRRRGSRRPAGGLDQRSADGRDDRADGGGLVVGRQADRDRASRPWRATRSSSTNSSWWNGRRAGRSIDASLPAAPCRAQPARAGGGHGTAPLASRAMTVTVRVPTTLRPLTGGKSEVQVEGATVGEVLANLDAAHPGFQRPPPRRRGRPAPLRQRVRGRRRRALPRRASTPRCPTARRSPSSPPSPAAESASAALRCASLGSYLALGSVECSARASPVAR